MTNIAAMIVRSIQFPFSMILLNESYSAMAIMVVVPNTAINAVGIKNQSLSTSAFLVFLFTNPPAIIIAYVMNDNIAEKLVAESNAYTTLPITT
jgi:hypothetical protein